MEGFGGLGYSLGMIVTSGLRVQSLRFRVQGLFRVEGLGFRVEGLGFRVEGFLFHGGSLRLLHGM